MISLVRALSVLGLAIGLCLLGNEVDKSYSGPVVYNPPDFAVGFSLSLDYGTASIWFSNGSSVDVAKIEGSPSYKQEIRLLEPRGTNSRNPVTEPLTISQLGLPSIRDTSRSVLRAVQQRLGLDSQVSAVEHMISALRRATESYLEHPIHAADIGFPMPITSSSEDKLSSAQRSIALYRASPYYTVGSLKAALSNRIYRRWMWPLVPVDPPQAILAIDFSRAALTLTLMSEYCEMYLLQRVFHNTSFGEVAISECTAIQGEDFCHEMLVNAIRPLVEMPILVDLLGEESGSFPVQDGKGVVNEVNALVLMGESAFDNRLALALKQVLGERYELLISKPSQWKGRERVDPVFAASRGIAETSWIYQQEYTPIYYT